MTLNKINSYNKLSRNKFIRTIQNKNSRNGIVAIVVFKILPKEKNVINVNLVKIEQVVIISYIVTV